MNTCPAGLAAVLAAADVDRLRGVEVYVFGSWLHDPAHARDVDVLVLYPEGALASGHWLADTIRTTPGELPYDVLALSTTEEQEVAFLANEGALRVWGYDPGAAHDSRP